MRNFLLATAVLVIGACEPTTTEAPPNQSAPAAAAKPQPPKLSRRAAISNFRSVVRIMEPVAEQECKRRAPKLNCDFKIVLDERPNQPPNAFQTMRLLWAMRPRITSAATCKSSANLPLEARSQAR